MAVSSVTNASTASTSTAASGSTSNAIDSTQFMQILLAEMKNQDPLQPMDNNQMIGQLTQLNSLDELKKIDTTLESILKYVEG